MENTIRGQPESKIVCGIDTKGNSEKHIEDMNESDKLDHLRDEKIEDWTLHNDITSDQSGYDKSTEGNTSRRIFTILLIIVTCLSIVGILLMMITPKREIRYYQMPSYPYAQSYYPTDAFLNSNYVIPDIFNRGGMYDRSLSKLMNDLTGRREYEYLMKTINGNIEHVGIEYVNQIPLEYINKLETIVFFNEKDNKSNIDIYKVEGVVRDAKKTTFTLEENKRIEVNDYEAIFYDGDNEVNTITFYDDLDYMNRRNNGDAVVSNDDGISTDDNSNYGTNDDSLDDNTQIANTFNFDNGRSNFESNDGAYEDSSNIRKLKKHESHAMEQHGMLSSPVHRHKKGMPKSFMDAYCRYGCGGMSVTFPYYYRPFFGYGYPLIGTQQNFPQGYGGYAGAPLLAQQQGPAQIQNVSVSPGLAGGFPVNQQPPNTQAFTISQ